MWGSSDSSLNYNEEGIAVSYEVSPDRGSIVVKDKFDDTEHIDLCFTDEDASTFLFMGGNFFIEKGITHMGLVMKIIMAESKEDWDYPQDCLSDFYYGSYGYGRVWINVNGTGYNAISLWDDERKDKLLNYLDDEMDGVEAETICKSLGKYDSRFSSSLYKKEIPQFKGSGVMGSDNLKAKTCKAPKLEDVNSIVNFVCTKLGLDKDKTIFSTGYNANFVGNNTSEISVDAKKSQGEMPVLHILSPEQKQKEKEDPNGRYHAFLKNRGELEGQKLGKMTMAQWNDMKYGEPVAENKISFKKLIKLISESINKELLK